MVLSEKCIMCKINKRCVLEDGERVHTLCFKCGYKGLAGECLSTVGSSSCDDEQRSFEEDEWEKRTKDKKRILI